MTFPVYMTAPDDIGIVTVKVVPSFGRLLTLIRPPWASTMCLAMASPRPVPPEPLGVGEDEDTARGGLHERQLGVGRDRPQLVHRVRDQAADVHRLGVEGGPLALPQGGVEPGGHERGAPG